MSFFEDFSPCTYFGPSAPALLAVGWLEEGKPFRKGEIKVEECLALAALLRDPWQPVAFAGRHKCGFCRLSGGPTEMQIGEFSVALGGANLFIPDGRNVIVAPSLVLHYIDAHGYAPDAQFWLAVNSCPPMRSIEYLGLLSRLGITKSKFAI